MCLGIYHLLCFPLKNNCNIFQTCLARLQSEFNSSQQRMKQRITMLEHKVTAVATGSGFLSDTDCNESVSGGEGVRSEINIRL